MKFIYRRMVKHVVRGYGTRVVDVANIVRAWLDSKKLDKESLYKYHALICNEMGFKNNQISKKNFVDILVMGVV